MEYGLCYYLKLPTNNLFIFFVVAMQITTCVNVTKPNPLVLLPDLSRTFDFKPENNWPKISRQGQVNKNNNKDLLMKMGNSLPMVSSIRLIISTKTTHLYI